LLDDKNGGGKHFIFRGGKSNTIRKDLTGRADQRSIGHRLAEKKKIFVVGKQKLGHGHCLLNGKGKRKHERS